MKRSHALTVIFLSLFLCLFSSCISREAAEEQTPQVSESTAFHTVTFYQNGAVLQQIPVRHGELLSQVPGGMEWEDEDGQSVDFATLAVVADLDLYARQTAALRTDHVRFMTGENNMFRPKESVTRGQAAQAVYSLLQSGTVPAAADGPAYTDLTAGDACYESVSALTALGIMRGYGDGSFRPNEPITRGEMVAMLCRAMNVEPVNGIAFQDVPAEHWAMGYVGAAMTKGWLSGYGDGAFYPDYPLTRAEAVVLIDRARGKTPNKAAIDMACPVSPYRDISKKNWAYYDIVDVSFSNDFLAYVMGEVPDAETGFMFFGDDMAHLNAEKKLDYFQKGFHTIQDGLPTDGLYYAPDNGYFLRRSQPGLQELDGSMFYVDRQDGPFLTNVDVGYLHFGENGRYTSGSAEVDGYVDAILADVIRGDTANLLNEERLRDAYNKIVFGDYDYMVRNTGWQRGTTRWSLKCAKSMYKTKRGTCYYWAASFLYLARRLGYQAYPVVGGVNENNALHAWVMIDEGENEYIYDVEMDWAYRTGAHGRVPIREGRDLFKQLRGNSVIVYIFPGDTWYAPPLDDTDAFGSVYSDELYQDENGNRLVEGVDYTVTYQDNGDGTVTVTITYLTGSRAGTTSSYTETTEEFNSTTPAPPGDSGQTVDPNTGLPVDPDTGWSVDPNTGLPVDPNTGLPVDPNTGRPVDPDTGTNVDPNGGTAGNPNAGTPVDPNGGTAGDPNAGAPVDPNGGTAGDPNAGAPTDPSGGTAGDPNAGAPADPNAGGGAPAEPPAEQPPVAADTPAEAAAAAAETAAAGGGQPVQ